MAHFPTLLTAAGKQLALEHVSKVNKLYLAFSQKLRKEVHYVNIATQPLSISKLTQTRV